MEIKLQEIRQKPLNLFISKTFNYGILLLIIMAITSCGKLKLPQLQKLTPLPKEPSCRIAVLPLNNESSHPLAAKIVYKIFMAELISASKFDVIQEGNILKTYRQLRIFPGKQPNFDQLQILADRLNVQLFVTGTVNEVKENPSSRYTDPSLTLTIQIVDAHSGRTIWTTYHKRTGFHYQKVMHFGIVTSLSGLAKKMSQEIIDLWFREGLEPCIDQ